MNFNLNQLLKRAFLEGVNFQIDNESGTDIEGWEEAFDKWLSKTNVFQTGNNDN